jgi:protein-S-isoprenylcysteine O-methyltransferase Ste14
MASQTAPPRTPPSRLRQAAQAVLMTAIWMGGMFLGAGRLAWTRGWIVVALALATYAVLGVIVHHANPGLMTERARWQRPDTKSFDRIVMPALILLFMVQPAAAGWEAGCADCSSLPWAWLYPGIALYLIGTVVVGWVMVVNRHAETSVRIQTDRGHTVVTRGPYRFVRHPMYAGASLIYIGMPLIWGARRWAPVISGALVILFVIRTALEDRTLRRELAGYEHYTTLTRYRLVPGVW